MRIVSNFFSLLILATCFSPISASAAYQDLIDDQPSTQQETDGKRQNSVAPKLIAPRINSLSAEDISFAGEKKLPFLTQPFINTRPEILNDGIEVGSLNKHSKTAEKIVAFANEIAAGKHGNVDSLLIYHADELVFESYYRRGRINYPHFQMSITKSYTALAIGRAIQLGHLSSEDLNKPVVSFLKDVDQSKIVSGASDVTLGQAMNMHSGIRVEKETQNRLRTPSEILKGQGQIQAFFENSEPISKESQQFKYQGCDPSMAMQVLETVVPGSAREFITKELLGKMNINNFVWPDDVSGLPKSAAGSSMRSRDMIKFGILVANKGKWEKEQLIPETFIEEATGKRYTNKQETSYGYFWWRNDMKVGDQSHDCISGRGAGGQFILVIAELDLIVVITAHDLGMVGKMLLKTPTRILPEFVE